MKRTPFRPVVPLSEKLLGLPLELPSLQSFPRLLGMRFLQVPRYTISSVSANPLSIEIDVYINIETSLYVDRHIRGRYGLAKGGRGCNGREEGDEDFEIV